MFCWLVVSRKIREDTVNFQASTYLSNLNLSEKLSNCHAFGATFSKVTESLKLLLVHIYHMNGSRRLISLLKFYILSVYSVLADTCCHLPLSFFFFLFCASVYAHDRVDACLPLVLHLFSKRVCKILIVVVLVTFLSELLSTILKYIPN